jgi:hypothetical protein
MRVTRLLPLDAHSSPLGYVIAADALVPAIRAQIGDA